MSKRRDLSLGEKNELLKRYDALPKMSQREAADKLSISQPLLCKFLKKRDTIQAACLNNGNTNRKRKRCGKDEEVEMALKEWFTANVKGKNPRIDGPLMRRKAEDLAKQMGKDDFRATSGWFTRWQHRENVVYSGKPHGTDQAEADDTTSAAKTWICNEWPAIVSQYEPSEVYNANDTGLFYRASPERGDKACKERITVLCCVSMTGEKRELLVIGKGKNPRYFKGVKQLPVDYFSSQNARMTPRIFSEWLTKWDKDLKRRVLLTLADNFSAHVAKDLKLKNIQVVYLPANTIQPCDQGIINNLKLHYKKEMGRRILHDLGLLDALHLIAQSWNSVHDSTVRNCFRKGGFTSGETEEDEPPIPNIPNNMSEGKFDEWVNIDEYLEISCKIPEEEICSRIANRGQQQADPENAELDDDVALDTPPSARKVEESLEILRRHMQFNGENFQLHYEYEKYIRSTLENKKY